jgi:hypothetical protein
MRLRVTQREHFFRIKLHGKPDDRFHAPKMHLEHQAVVWKYRTHQIVDAVTWLQKSLEQHAAQIVVAELTDFSLGDERRGRAYLAIVADDED